MRKLRIIRKDLARVGTHVVVFLSGWVWLQGPFRGPHLHLQLRKLGRDMKEEDSSDLGPTIRTFSCSLPCPLLWECHQDVRAACWWLHLPRAPSTSHRAFLIPRPTDTHNTAPHCLFLLALPCPGPLPGSLHPSREPYEGD